MGLMKKILEGAIQVQTFGLSDKLGITGKGGVIHDGDDDPDKQAVIVDKTGIRFNASGIHIDWNSIKKIALQDEGLFRIDLRGGLIVLTGWIHWDENWLALHEKECKGKCDHKSLLDDRLDCDNYDDERNRNELAIAIKDVFWASDLADKIRDSEHIVLLEFTLLRHYYIVYLVLLNICDEIKASDDDEEMDKRFHRFLGVIEKFDELLDIIKSQMACVDGDDEDEFDLIAGLFAHSRVHGKGITVQAKLYDNLRNARAYGYKFDDDEPVTVLTSDSKEEGFKPLGDSEWANLRRTIVCTDERAALTTWREGLQIPDAMVIDARDIIAYNDRVEQGLQLKFEANHPQNGIVYIQHPIQKNVYIDMKSFNSSMLEQKYSELIRLLNALGATMITCEVENNKSTDEKHNRKASASANVDVPLAGEVSGQYERGTSSARMQTVYKKLQTRIVNRELKNEKPYVPEGLLFYPFEDDWKNLAQDVLKGRRLEEETTLTYREDFAMTGRQLSSIGAKLKSVIPMYEFGVGGSFTQEFEEELKQLQSTVWRYHVKFGSNDLAPTENDAARTAMRTLMIKTGESLVNIVKERMSK